MFIINESVIKESRLLLILACFIIFSFTLEGQNSLGIKAGVNVANQVGGDMDNDLLVGFDGGVSAMLRLTGNLSFQPEILFSTKGCTYDFERIHDDGTIRNYEHYIGSWKIHYLEIPLLVNLAFLSGHEFRPQIFAGFSPAFKIKGTYDEDYELKNYEDGILVHEESGHDKGDIQQIKLFDLGLTVGAGAIWGSFSLDARYTAGLYTLSTDNDFEIRNSVFSILIGYYFPMKQ